MAAMYADAAAFGFKVLSEEDNRNEDRGILQNKQIDNAILTQFQTPHEIEDFIVIAEFSEVTGPIPLLTIPPNIADGKSFDINNFIMKIMSVDYQANPGGHFQTCEDVQVLTSEKRLSAYVHYTMLHDLQARGWVRPFCIAYITSDLHKLQRNFDALRKMFLQISKLLKYDNCHWFKDEMLKALDAIREKQVKYFNYKKKEVDGFPLSFEEESEVEKIDIDLIVHQYTEYQHLLHTVDQSLDSEDHQNTINIWKERLLLSESTIPQVASYLSELWQKDQMSDEITTKENSLKAILALCPWGFAAGLWSLLSILQSQCLPDLEQKFCLILSMSDSSEQNMKIVDDALLNPHYLNLLVAPKQKCELALDSGETNWESYMFSSANDATASSSYHSMAESLSDLPKDLDQSSDNESYLDISETFHTDDSDEESEDEEETICYWKQVDSQNKVLSGHRLLKFFCKFDKVVSPVIYSLLTGRTVVISGNESSRQKVARLVTALSRLVPVSESHLLKKLTWHCGILVASHIAEYQVIGLCVPERLSIHDMISPKDKNTISILDIESKQFFGPAYSGQLLSSLSKIIPNVTKDLGLQLYLHFIASCISERVLVYKTLLAERSQDKASSILKDMNLQGCDAEVVKFISTLAS